MRRRSSAPVRYVDRRTGQVCEETVLGEQWLRWTYESHLGRLLLPLIRLPLISRIYGWWQTRPRSQRQIARFVEELGIDPGESEHPPQDYATLGAFFARRLRPGARPVDADPHTLVSPADGRALLYAGLQDGVVIPQKGCLYSLEGLLGDAALAHRYVGGDALALRLCPRDYHRFHFPATGLHRTVGRLPGPLLSVSPIALATGIQIFTRNRRQVSILTGTPFGDLVQVEVGATMVGCIVTTAPERERVQRGQEKGTFELGGSAILLLTPPGAVQWDADLLENTARGLETLVRAGERLGSRCGPPD